MSNYIQIQKGVKEMKNLTLLCFGIAALGALALPAGAEPYWVAYEGNDLPENEGWNRSYGNWDGEYQGEAVRSVENGILTIDSLFDEGVYDYAYLEMPGRFSLEPGEAFVAEWRLKVVDLHATYEFYDPTMSICTDDAWILEWGFYKDRVVSSLEDNVTIPIIPDLFHVYQCISWDMRSYEFYIDGELKHEGSFWRGIMHSAIAWGDVVGGAASDSRWDYFRFGVVPEPNGLLSLALCAFCSRCLCKHLR